MRHQSLLIVIAAVSTSLVMADNTLDESRAVEKIGLLGGKVTRDEKAPERPVIGVDFQDSARFNDKYLHLMNSFPGLRSLNLEGVRISDAGLERINELRQLFPSLNVCYDDPKEARQIQEISRLGGAVTREETRLGRPVVCAILVGGKFQDQQMRLLDTLTILNELHILDAGLTDNGLATVVKIETLRTLNLRACRITDAGAMGFVGLPQLTQLRLDSCVQITDASMKAIGQLKNVSLLGLGKTKVTDVGLRNLKSLSNLTNFDLCGTAITDAGLDELSDFPNLTTLDLAETKITDDGLKRLVKLTKLTSLDLMFCKQITDAGLKELGEIKTLSKIRLYGADVTDAGVRELQEALPKLQIIR